MVRPTGLEPATPGVLLITIWSSVSLVGSLVRICLCMTVRAQQPQIAPSVVVSSSVLMVQIQRDQLAIPCFPFALVALPTALFNKDFFDNVS